MMVSSRILLLAIFGFSLWSTVAFADYGRWTAEIEEDPFTKSVKVTASYMSTVRSGVFVFCDSKEDGVRVRVVPGWTYVDELEGFKPTLEFAIDGQVLMSQQGTTTRIGDNLAVSEAALTGPNGRNWTKAFAKAKNQVAIKDGISDGPHLLKAFGSTKSGEALLACLELQPDWRENDQDNAPGEVKKFVGIVLAETDNVWSEIFRVEGLSYETPSISFFSEQMQSVCNFSSPVSGPFYCPGLREAYFDTEFLEKLAQQADTAAEFAQAYLVAHTVGHHVQNLVGILPKFNEARQKMSEAEATALAVRIELQADCFAGVWGYYTNQKRILGDSKVDEALNAAQQIGDDTMQKRAQGYVVPESFNHGTSAQRKKWLLRGLRSGKISECDTFAGDI